MRNQREKRNRQNVEIKKRIRKESVYMPRTVKMSRVQNIPFDNNGYPDRNRADIQDYGKVFKGFHTLWQAILFNERGMAYLRVVVT